MVTTARVTADEFLTMPDDGLRHELVSGEVISMPPAGLDHGDDALTIGLHLRRHVDRHGGGRVVVKVGFLLFHDPDTVRAPDVAFVSEARLPPAEERSRFVEGPPDLAVEVVSPGDTATEVLTKVQEYLTAGARLVWVVERRTRTVSIYRADGTVQLLRSGETLSGEDVLPGFALLVNDIFS